MSARRLVRKSVLYRTNNNQTGFYSTNENIASNSYLLRALFEQIIVAFFFKIYIYLNLPQWPRIAIMTWIFQMSPWTRTSSLLNENQVVITAVWEGVMATATALKSAAAEHETFH